MFRIGNRNTQYNLAKCISRPLGRWEVLNFFKKRRESKKKAKGIHDSYWIFHCRSFLQRNWQGHPFPNHETSAKRIRRRNDIVRNFVHAHLDAVNVERRQNWNATQLMQSMEISFDVANAYAVLCVWMPKWEFVNSDRHWWQWFCEKSFIMYANETRSLQRHFCWVNNLFALAKNKLDNAFSICFTLVIHFELPMLRQFLEFPNSVVDAARTPVQSEHHPYRLWCAISATNDNASWQCQARLDYTHAKEFRTNVKVTYIGCYK